MAVLAVDEVMLREPRLLVPGMQPLGLVKVAWNNPLAKGLCFAWMASRPNVDLARNTMRASVLGVTTGATAAGIWSKSSGGDSGHNWGNQPVITGTAGSILVLAAPVSSSSIKVAFDQRQNGSPYLEWYTCFNLDGGMPGPGRLQMKVTTTGSACEAQTGATPVVDGTLKIFAGTFHIGVSAKVYVNGVDKTSYSASGSGTFYNSAQLVRVGNVSGYTGSEYAMSDPLYVMLVWDRALTAAEVAAISADPYQVFVPA